MESSRGRVCGVISDEEVRIFLYYRSKAPSRMSVNAETAVSMQWEART